MALIRYFAILPGIIIQLKEINLSAKIQLVIITPRVVMEQFGLIQQVYVILVLVTRLFLIIQLVSITHLLVVILFSKTLQVFIIQDMVMSLFVTIQLVTVIYHWVIFLVVILLQVIKTLLSV